MNTKLINLGALALPILLMLLPGAVGAEELRLPAVTDTLRTADDCLQCHTPGSNLGKFELSLGEMHDPEEGFDYRQDPEVFFASNHGQLECRVCHIIGKELYPHLAEAKENYFTCTYCHERDQGEPKYDVEQIKSDFEKSVHFQAQGEKFRCFTCHDPHVFDLTDPDKPVELIIRDDNAICRRCHEEPNEFLPLTDREFPVLEQVHDWLPNTALHWQAVRCVECHTSHSETFNHEILDKERSEKRCEACHSRDSILLTTLYKYKAQEERSQFGFVNAVIFGEAYVIGVTRNPTLDRLSLAILALTLIGLVIHGLLRGAFALRRPRR